MRDWGENIGKVGNECKSMLVNKLVLTMVLHPAFFFFSLRIIYSMSKKQSI